MLNNSIGERVYIGLGSNLADPAAQLRQAMEALGTLPQTQLIAVSSFYASDSLLPGQPRFVNAVAALNSQLDPHVLLDALQALEHQQGRVRHSHWGPRTLDLDILLFGNRVIDTPRLQVPHLEMTQRAFVLYPLAELAPELIFPTGKTLEAALTECPFVGLEQMA